MISDRLEVLIEGSALTPEGLVLAATAQRLAAVLDNADTAPYTLPTIARELRATLQRLVETGSLDPNAPGLNEEEFEAFLGSLR